jgi:hypothetical protein
MQMQTLIHDNYNKDVTSLLHDTSKAASLYLL